MAKEILKDEILKDEELEQVAGGNRDELALDTQLFNALGDRFPAYTLREITSKNVNSISGQITALWNKAGIQVKYNDFGANSYSINGRPISRNEAVDKLAYNLGYHDIDTTPFKI